MPLTVGSVIHLEGPSCRWPRPAELTRLIEAGEDERMAYLIATARPMFGPTLSVSCVGELLAVGDTGDVPGMFERMCERLDEMRTVDSVEAS